MIEWNKSMEKHCHHYYYWGERGSLSHLPDTFNRHCNLGLSCPRTSIANELMNHLQDDPEWPASVASLLGRRAHYWHLLGLGPHLDYEWASTSKARYAPSASNTHPGSAVGWYVCGCVFFSAAWWAWFDVKLQPRHLLWSCWENTQFVSFFSRDLPLDLTSHWV